MLRHIFSPIKSNMAEICNVCLLEEVVIMQLENTSKDANLIPETIILHDTSRVYCHNNHDIPRIVTLIAIEFPRS